MSALSNIKLPEEKSGPMTERTRLIKKFNRISIEFIGKLGNRMNLTPDQKMYLGKLNTMGIQGSTLLIGAFATFVDQFNLGELYKQKADVQLKEINKYEVFSSMSNKTQLACISYLGKLVKLEYQYKKACEKENYQASGTEKLMGMIPTLLQKLDKDLIKKVITELPEHIKKSFAKNGVKSDAFINVLLDIVDRVMSSDTKLCDYMPMVQNFTPMVVNAIKTHVFDE